MRRCRAGSGWLTAVTAARSPFWMNSWTTCGPAIRRHRRTRAARRPATMPRRRPGPRPVPGGTAGEKLAARRPPGRAGRAPPRGRACAGIGPAGRRAGRSAGPSWPRRTPGSPGCPRGPGRWTSRRWPGCWRTIRMRPPRCWPTWRWPPTPSCGRPRGDWPGGCSPGSARRAGRRPAAPGGWGGARAATAISTWTGRWTGWRAAGRPARMSWSPGPGWPGGGRCACWWTPAAR